MVVVGDGKPSAASCLTASSPERAIAPQLLHSILCDASALSCTEPSGLPRATGSTCRELLFTGQDEHDLGRAPGRTTRAPAAHLRLPGLQLPRSVTQGNPAGTTRYRRRPVRIPPDLRGQSDQTPPQHRRTAAAPRRRERPVGTVPGTLRGHQIIGKTNTVHPLIRSPVRIVSVRDPLSRVHAGEAECFIWRMSA